MNLKGKSKAGPFAVLMLVVSLAAVVALPGLNGMFQWDGYYGYQTNKKGGDFNLQSVRGGRTKLANFKG